jgi:hypothetical protein
MQSERKQTEVYLQVHAEDTATLYSLKGKCWDISGIIYKQWLHNKNVLKRFVSQPNGEKYGFHDSRVTVISN